MCFGSSKQKPIPPPTPPTRFEYLPAGGKSQQQQAATTANTVPQASYGAELGTADAAAPTTGG